MSDPSDLPPLDEELTRLLRAEANTQTGPSADLSRAMLSRLEAALPLTLPTPDLTPDPQALPQAQAAGAAAKAAVIGKTAAGASLLTKLVLAGALVGSGMVAGAGMHAALAPSPEPRIVTKTVEVRVPVYVPAPPKSPEPQVAPVITEDAGLKKPVTPAHTEPPQDERDRLLEKENALITRAQSALARREAKLAIGALEAHAARFDKGQLSEEREALWVQALAMAGESEAARARAERFKKRYPRSMLMPAVDAALRGTP